MRSALYLRSTSILFLAAFLLASPLDAATRQQSINLGDSVKAEILAAGDTVELVFAAVANTLLDVKVKAGKGGNLIPSLTLKDNAGTGVALGASLISKGATAQIKKFPMPASGTYTLEIRSGSGTGDFSAKTKGKFPKKLVFSGEFPAKDTLSFDVLAGSLLKGGKVKAAKGSTFEPQILSLSSSAEAIPLAGATAKGSSAKFKSATVAAAAVEGWLTVTWLLGGTGTGPYTAKVSAKAPKSKMAYDLTGISGFTRVGVNTETGLSEYRHTETGILFVLLPGGTFEMGSPDTEPRRGGDEGPVHTVTLSSFLIAKYEVTQAEYQAVMGENPSFFTGDDSRPVDSVTWDALKAADGFLDRTGLALPTEAQWEYACRAGQSGPYAGTGNLDDMGWYMDNSGDRTFPVGQKAANQFGLYDMHGNLSEWCEDVYDPAFYASAAASVLDPVSTAGSEFRINRGGSWGQQALFCRSASRQQADSFLVSGSVGFRPVRALR